VSLEPSSKYNVTPLNTTDLDTTAAARDDLLVPTLHYLSVCGSVTMFVCLSKYVCKVADA